MAQDSIQSMAAAASAPLATIPPTTVAAASFLGYSPSEWLIWVSIGWILLQATCLVIDRVLRVRKALRDKR